MVKVLILTEDNLNVTRTSKRKVPNHIFKDGTSTSTIPEDQEEIEQEARDAEEAQKKSDEQKTK